MKFFDEKDREKKKKDISKSSYILDTPNPDAVTPNRKEQERKEREMKELAEKDPKSPIKKTKTMKEQKEDMDVRLSVNLSEVSINDFGTFDLRIPIMNVPIEDKRTLDKRRSAIKTTKGSPLDDMNKNNLVKHLGEIFIDPSTGKQSRIATKRIDIISHTMKEENDYILFDIVNVEKIVADCSSKDNKLKDLVI